MNAPLADPQPGERPFDVAGASGPRHVLWWTVLPVWAFTAVQAAVIMIFTAGTAGTWLPIAFSLATLMAFILQLAVPTTPGHVSRLGWAIGGAFLVLLIPTVILYLTVEQAATPG